MQERGVKIILVFVIIFLFVGASDISGSITINNCDYYKASSIGMKINVLDTVTVPDDYPTIQEAIDNANNGDTVFVKSGIYYEEVEVDKSINLIGEDRNTTIIMGSGDRKSTRLNSSHYS